MRTVMRCATPSWLSAEAPAPPRAHSEGAGDARGLLELAILLV
eukprot:CAMPEP_0114165448 /NCGR_PEP_ID=MMETSP0043_2-20121206/31259_1 /TAXON_ID=464988 /ORGANISM="Hemiselmis andersenii, Strain CCMP644" /LENGTH=42 /DNA_ID= /DNA_START= /DNA_END= /DNA_ORIENTATION=